jgi:hypothetical protein
MLRHFLSGVNETVTDVFRLCNAGGLSRLLAAGVFLYPREWITRYHLA